MGFQGEGGLTTRPSSAERAATVGAPFTRPTEHTTKHYEATAVSQNMLDAGLDGFALYLMLAACAFYSYSSKIHSGKE
jgi:hypothetical protein